ncbi:hypothetical protein Nepgr_031354 [Nepenthes gracilis]|uniref:Uncharacterized protein n=1 Tax=Nepenthes gracilis TaxID=150966 RepID=A0AAD3TIB2_NEPGR|nr:hypothetical protein Nepgr_031354 [Nepenthes gracilis]
MQIRGEKFLKWPKTLKKDSGNQSKYCDFHRTAGHSTEDCKTLRGNQDSIRAEDTSLDSSRDRTELGRLAMKRGGAHASRNRIAAGVVNMVTTRPARSPEDSKEQQTGRKK